ncbi:hypothetical protein U9M48_013441 [Paspalum notatum var. saurae]|uniref:Chromo domain-containing protein n=1 Tax=Paspalum notatum var. saurae TaxID=547442 RepID=A0AAQ3SZD1_PASNO
MEDRLNHAHEDRRGKRLASTLRSVPLGGNGLCFIVHHSYITSTCPSNKNNTGGRNNPPLAVHHLVRLLQCHRPNQVPNTPTTIVERPAISARIVFPDGKAKHHSWGSHSFLQDLKQKFWWTHMKREIAKYVSECDVCQRVKADHLKPAGERVTFGPDLVTQAEEQVKFIHDNLKRAQSRQKSYSDKRRRPLVFEKDDHVYLRVSPMKGVHRFGVKGKLAPRYVGPFKITEQCGPVAYRLELPPHLAAVHDVFHVSQLKKCLRVPEEVINTSQIQIKPDLTYEEKPIKILEQKQRSTRRRTINFYKVQWSNHSEEEATWEQEEFLQTKYPEF